MNEKHQETYFAYALKDPSGKLNKDEYGRVRLFKTIGEANQHAHWWARYSEAISVEVSVKF